VRIKNDDDPHSPEQVVVLNLTAVGLVERSACWWRINTEYDNILVYVCLLLPPPILRSIYSSELFQFVLSTSGRTRLLLSRHGHPGCCPGIQVKPLHSKAVKYIHRVPLTLITRCCYSELFCALFAECGPDLSGCIRSLYITWS